MHCSGCGQQIATADKFCNGCGRPIAVVPIEVKKKKTHPLVALLAVVLFLIVLGAIIGGVMRGTVTDSPSAVSAADKAEDDRRFARASVGALMLKKAARNPDSFKLSSALVISSTGTVCYEYHAQNGFGGFNKGFAVLTPEGKFKSDEMDGFHALWNKECAHKTGTEQVDVVNYVLAHK
jgi:hypothetical protein